MATGHLRTRAAMVKYVPEGVGRWAERCRPREPDSTALAAATDFRSRLQPDLSKVEEDDRAKA